MGNSTSRADGERLATSTGIGDVRVRKHELRADNVTSNERLAVMKEQWSAP